LALEAKKTAREAAREAAKERREVVMSLVPNARSLKSQSWSRARVAIHCVR
jgi:hypothetical protein